MYKISSKNLITQIIGADFVEMFSKIAPTIKILILLTVIILKLSHSSKRQTPKQNNPLAECQKQVSIL